MFPGYSWILGFIVGAAVGSFLNMAIYRLPNRVSFIDPSRSFCPRCKHPLGAIDLIPLLSWLSTRGKCRYCHEPVASRYFWVEMLTGSLFAGIWHQYLVAGDSVPKACFYMAACACLVAIIFIDGEHFIIPDEINAALLVIGVGLQVVEGTPMNAFWGALTGWGILFAIQLLGRLAFAKDAMGDGDTKMMRGVGALIGPMLVVADLAVAVVLGLIGGIVGIILSKRAQQAKAGTPIEGDLSGDDQELPAPTPIGFILFANFYYFLCLDVVALFVKPVDKWAASMVPMELLEVEGEDNWKPGVTTIPFGPYLAAGALVCMLFAAPIEKWMRDYFSGGAPQASNAP